jgi:hypothetical protein
VPLRATLCGLFGALSEILSVEVRPFFRVGVNVTVAVQLAPGASPAPPIGQLLVCAKSPVLPVARLIPEMIRFDPPVLVIVTICGALVTPTLVVGNVNDVGFGVIAGAVIPVPVSVTVCGLVTSESVMVSCPVSTPVVVGANLTLILQLRPGAKAAPMQLLVSEKLALQVTLLIVSVVMPTLTTVTVCAALSVPTSWSPNSRELVLRLIPETFCVTGVVDVLPTKLGLAGVYVAARDRWPPVMKVRLQRSVGSVAVQLSPVLADTVTVPRGAVPATNRLTVN